MLTPSLGEGSHLDEWFHQGYIQPKKERWIQKTRRRGNECWSGTFRDVSFRSHQYMWQSKLWRGTRSQELCRQSEEIEAEEEEWKRFISWCFLHSPEAPQSYLRCWHLELQELFLHRSWKGHRESQLWFLPQESLDFIDHFVPPGVLWCCPPNLGPNFIHYPSGPGALPFQAIGKHPRRCWGPL